MALTVAEIAREMGGVLEGAGEALVSGLAGLAEARAGDISFLANPRYAAEVAVTKASAVVVNRDWKGASPCPVIRVNHADQAFTRIAELLLPKAARPAPGVHPTAVLGEGVTLGPDGSIGPYCVLGSGVTVGARTVLYAGCYLGAGTRVGDDCIFYPHVSTREHTRIGHRVIVHNGAVIGSDGFGYFQEAGVWKKIPQLGTVEVGDDAEIGANVTIDRARFGRTVIGRGVKIDNLVQIAHNVRIGDHTAMAAQVGISGSTVVGHHVQIGGQAGLGGHLAIGDESVVGAQAGVTKDVVPRTYVSGYPAMPHEKAAKMHAHVMRLPELKQRVAELEKRVEGIEKS